MTQPTYPPWPMRNQEKRPRKKSKQQDKIIEAIAEGSGAIVTPEIIEDFSSDIKDIINDEDNIAFRANPGPQTDFLASSEREVLYGGSKGGGKAVGYQTLIPTPFGFKTIGELKVGDVVFSGDGSQTEVIRKSIPKVEKNSYAVHFNTGEIVTANCEHLWTVRDAIQRGAISRRKGSKNKRTIRYKINTDEKIITTEEMASSIYVYEGKARTANYSIENCGPIVCQIKNLLISPYLFGLWLGDGFSNAAVIGMDKEDLDEILDYIEQPEWVKYSKQKNRLFQKIKFAKAGVLRELGVYKNKHIPVAYLRSSFEQRLELLQGIMDTDGHCMKKKGQCELTFKSKKLLENVHELLSSLGIKTTINSRIARCQTGYECEVYRLHFYTSLPVFKLKRKLSVQHRGPFRPSVTSRFITKIEPIEPTLMQCITVDNSTGTFLIGESFIKTHNSFSLFIDPLRYCHSKNSRALIIRRSTPDLRDMISKSHQIYPKAYPDVRWSAKENMWRFPSGATIEFTFCENPSDLPRFQGINMTYCGIDEAASHPYLPELLNYIRSNIRSVDPINVPPMLRMTANPGEVASHYLRAEFVERAPVNTTFWDHVKIFDIKKKETRTVSISKKYIPATIFDNPYLLKDDSYLATLASLPETKRKQWLEGDWFVSEMSAFPDFDKNMHVVAPFEIPRDWKRLKGADWGFTSPGCAYWAAVSPSGQVIVYREFVFQKKDALRVANEGKAMEIGEGRSVGILDASAWQQRGTLGQPIGEVFQQNWPSWVPSSRARVANTGSRAHRKNLVHQHLAINPLNGEPRLVVFPNCRKLIEALSGLPIDKNNPETVDTDSPLDHYFDALSYMLQGRPSRLQGWLDPFERKIDRAYQIQDQQFGY